MATPYDPAPARFHVQSTGEHLVDDFPCFPHHRSVEALWSGKWRPLAAKAIYPFYDGAVEDFDPIFAALEARSPGDPAILYRPDDYAAPFLPVGDALAAQADTAAARGDDEAARLLYLRAAAVFRIARFPVVRSPLGEQAWSRGKAAYERAGALMRRPVQALDVPFTRAGADDERRPIPAYLRTPGGARPAAGWPVLLFICGLDSYRTDNTVRLDEHLCRGFATLIFEIPGTGDCPAAAGDPDGADRLIDSVLDWVEAEAPSRGFDLDRVVARAISTGGYYASRAAHRQRDRLRAVAEQGGGCHHMFDPRWIAHQDQMEYPFALAEALAWKFGFRGDDAVARYMAEGARFSLLDAGILDEGNTRLLVHNGMEDSIFPIEDSFVVATKGSGKDVSIVGGTGHMGNPAGETWIPEWLSRAIA